MDDRGQGVRIAGRAMNAMNAMNAKVEPRGNQSGAARIVQALVVAVVLAVAACGGSSTPKYWLGAPGQTLGPYDVAALQGFVRDGRVSAATPLLPVGGTAWTTAGQVAGLIGPNGAAGAAGVNAADVSGMQRPDGKWGVVTSNGSDVRWLTSEAYDDVSCVVGSAACILRSGNRCGIFMRKKAVVGVPVTHACAPDGTLSTWSPCPGECIAFDDGSRWVVKDDAVAASVEAPPAAATFAPDTPDCSKVAPVADASFAADLRNGDWRSLARHIDAEFDAISCSTRQQGQTENFAAINKRLQANGLTSLRVPVRVDAGLHGVSVRGDARSCTLEYTGVFGTQLFCRLDKSTIEYALAGESLPFGVACDGAGALPTDLSEVPFLGTDPYADYDDKGVIITVGRCLASGARGIVLVKR